MKSKILSYLLGWLLVLLLNNFFWYVNAQCGCEYYGYDPEEQQKCMDNCAQQQLQKKQQQQQQQECKDWCCGIKLNTDFPIIGNCIELKKWWTWVDPTTVMPNLMWSLMKIIMSIIMVVCFIMIIVWGIYWASNDAKKWRDLIKKAAVTVLLLWLSGVILKVINPTFFS